MDKDNYFDTPKRCFEQALTGFESILSLMKQAPYQSLGTKNKALEKERENLVKSLKEDLAGKQKYLKTKQAAKN